jgi:hypothetical protein
MFETLSKQQLNAMTSDEYKQNFEGSSGDDFRKRVAELEARPAQATRPRGSVRGAEPAPTPAETSFDQAFDDEPAEAQAAAVEPSLPVAAQPAAAATVDESLPELVYEYQPVSKITGKSVGGLQRFKYRTQDELIQKLAAAHSAASARIRELSRDRKLEEISAAGATPRTQPEKEVPTTVEGLAAELRAQRESNFILSVRAALSEFQASVNWTKFRSEENAKSMVLAVGRAGDDPTDPQSYHRAFANMQQFLEPVVPATAAATVEPTPTPAPVVAPVVVPPAPAVRPGNVTRPATGLSNADILSSDSPIEPVVQANAGPNQGWTFEKIEKLPTDQYRRIVRDPKMAQLFDRILQAHEEKRAAARRGR